MDDLNCPLPEFRRAVQFSQLPCQHPLRLKNLEAIKGCPTDHMLAFIYASKGQVRRMVRRRCIASAYANPILATNIRLNSDKLSFEEVVRAHCRAKRKEHEKVTYFVAIFISNRFRRIGDQVLTDKDGEKTAYQFWWRRGGEAIPYDILMSGKVLFSGGGECRLPNSKYNCPMGENPSAYCKRLRVEYRRQFSRPWMLFKLWKCLSHSINL